MFSKQFDPKQVPIRFEVVDGDGHVEVPGLVEAGSERVPNPMPDQPALDPQVNALAVPFYTGPMQVRRAKVLKLTDPNMTFEHSGSSSLVGSFEYAGPRRECPYNPTPPSARMPSSPRSAKAGWGRCIGRGTPSSTETSAQSGQSDE